MKFLSYIHVYACVRTCSEYSLIHHNLFLKIWWIDEFGGLTGCALVLVYYIGTGKLCRIEQWWIDENSLYSLCTL